MTNQYAITQSGESLFLRKHFWASLPKKAAKITRPLMPAAAPAVLLHSSDTQQGVSNIILAMTRRDFGKPAFSLRKKTLRENSRDRNVAHACFRPITSSVSAVSNFVANGYQTMQHVSTSPPAIPDGQISRVRF
jgi:hypothetical protein